MLITVKGIVIRERSIGERDKYIDILTDTMGIIEVSAKGTKKLTGKNAAASALFTYSTFCLEERKGKYYINSSAPITSFYAVGQDLEKLSLAVYFTEIIRFAASTEEDCGEVQRLLLLSLFYLCKEKSSCEIIKSAFELKLMCIIGFMPDAEACIGCGRLEDLYGFSIENSGLLCSNCCSEKNCVPVTASCVKAIRHIIYSETDRVFSFSLVGKSLEQLIYISENYVRFHLEHSFKSLDYYYSIKPKE